MDANKGRTFVSIRGCFSSPLVAAPPRCITMWAGLLRSSASRSWGGPKGRRNLAQALPWVHYIIKVTSPVRAKNSQSNCAGSDGKVERCSTDLLIFRVSTPVLVR
jgi:hypothetical protein